MQAMLNAPISDSGQTQLFTPLRTRMSASASRPAGPYHDDAAAHRISASASVLLGLPAHPGTSVMYFSILQWLHCTNRHWYKSPPAGRGKLDANLRRAVGLVGSSAALINAPSVASKPQDVVVDRTLHSQYEFTTV
ncbi:hypothetical protein OK016_11955 [Vibrio chagasii]|nr:hypothetical protein [Vibrio chagasii]